MLMAALVAITTSFTLVSCGDDDDDQYKEGYFTLKAEAKLEGFSAAEMEEMLGQPTSETATNYMSEIQAKTYAESIGITIIPEIDLPGHMVAAMTSCISLVEVGVAFLSDRFGMRRPVGSIIIFFVCGLAGVVCSLSFGPLSSLTVGGKCIFDLFDWFASNILLLLAAFAVVVFVGFVMKKEDVWDEITNGGEFKVNVRLFDAIFFLIKWVAPVALFIIFVTNFIF